MVPENEWVWPSVGCCNAEGKLLKHSTGPAPVGTKGFYTAACCTAPHTAPRTEQYRYIAPYRAPHSSALHCTDRTPLDTAFPCTLAESSRCRDDAGGVLRRASNLWHTCAHSFFREPLVPLVSTILATNGHPPCTTATRETRKHCPTVVYGDSPLVRSVTLHSHQLYVRRARGQVWTRLWS